MLPRIAACLTVICLAGGWQDAPSPTARIDKLLDEGFALMAPGKYLDMERLGKEALELSKTANDRFRIARSTLLVGAALFYQGRLPEAEKLIVEGEKIAIEVNDIGLRKLAKQVLGNLARNFGRAEEALKHFDDWLALNRQAPKPESEARILRARGIVFYEMRDMDRADAALAEALAALKQNPDPGLEAATLMSVAVLLKARNEFAKAAPALEGARAAAIRANAKGVLAEILNSLGHTHIELGNLDEASKLLREAMDVATSIGYAGILAQLNERLAGVEMARKRPADAIPFFEKANEIYKASGGSPEKRWWVLHEWGVAERQLGRPEAALAHFLEGISLVEFLERFTVQTEMARALPISTRRPLFESTTGVLIDMKRDADALEMADRSRARGFLDTLRDAQIQPGAGRTPPPLATVAAIQRELTSPTAAFVEFQLGATRSFVWVARSNALRVVELPARDKVDALTESYRANLGRASSALTLQRDSAEISRQQRELYDLLLAPIAAELKGATELRIVPDGSLAYIPFEALQPSAGEYLIERHAISYSSSAAVGIMLQSLGAARQPAPKALVAFGFPNYSGTRSTASTDNASLTALPNTREEVVGIGGLYPASQRALHLAGAATEATAKSDAIAQYRYVHFAVHGLVDEAAPAKSGLALSPGGGADDGVLRMDEIAKLRLNADLVTLSACRTGVGKFLQGEGLMALSRAFFYAGAQKVVASLWDVNDASTSQLMRSFYAQLKAGRAPAQALQAAKLSMLRGSQRLWRHPHYWSPFVALQ